MNKKLTLNINDQIIDFAHNYSKKTHQSISAIVEKYFIALKNTSEDLNLTNTTNELHGILSDMPLPDKKQMRGEFHEKSID
ncbi:MAG: DUF6364 family protein [bacterium]